MNRRQFLAAAAAAPLAMAQKGSRRPNIVLFITDDQGYGDLSVHGNPNIRTPNIDGFAAEAAQFTQFHVCPVCSPTRATMLTGRYNYRTGVVDTYLGRSMMRPEETTIAEMLSSAGYRTGIFGKWHLGDNYPLRPGDQGFAESVVIRGGGLGQPSDVPGGGSYTNPVLLRNGKQERFEGYCTDIFVTEALRFIEANKDRPFFVYLPTNAPHTPLEIAEQYVAPYRNSGLDEATAKIYGMVGNIDQNFGRLTGRLTELGLADNTIVIFMTDNGPQQKRYNAGMRGLKGTVYEGGTRVPFFLRWPSAAKAGTKIDRLAAHIDVLPTLLESCHVRPSGKKKLDGRSLVPLLRDPSAKWEDRTIFFQWHRGEAPELYRACAARTQRWKLVDGKALYDLDADPAESKDVAAGNPEIVRKLRADYEAWFRDVSSGGYDPPRIAIGTTHENPVVFTRQDWRGPKAGWDPESLGYWEVHVAGSGTYEITIRFAKARASGKVVFRLNGANLTKDVDAGQEELVLGSTTIQSGDGRLEAEMTVGGKTTGVEYVTVRKIQEDRRAAVITTRAPESCMKT